MRRDPDGKKCVLLRTELFILAHRERADATLQHAAEPLCGEHQHSSERQLCDQTRSDTATLGQPLSFSILPTVAGSAWRDD